MANIYVRSTDGDNADNGSTWALSKATLAGAAAIDAAGDTIYLSQSHAESTASSINFPLAGTLASPTIVLCANDAAEPPTAQATTATISTTLSSGITFSGANYVVDGVEFNVGTGTGTVSINMGSSTGNRSEFKNCSMILGSSGSASRIDFTSAPSAFSKLTNVGFKFAHAGQGIRPNNNVFVEMVNCSLLSGGTSPTTLFLPSGKGDITARGFDLRNADSAINIMSAGQPTRAVFSNIALPTSWSGSFVTGTISQPVERYEFYNCDSSDTNYRIHVKDYSGTLDEETIIVRTGGASDGTTPLSWRIVTTANAKETPTPFATPPISVWNETVGSAVTATIEIIHDNATDLTDADVWVVVEYLGTSGVPMLSAVSDQRADILGSATNQATSAASWTTTGLTNPNEQKLSVSFTPQEKGFITARVFVGKPSYTLYVDPEITVT